MLRFRVEFRVVRRDAGPRGMLGSQKLIAGGLISTILTSNQSFGSWGDVFGYRVIASAILDRILHHATTISIRGDSYRLKDKLKSRVVKPTTAGT